MIKRKRALPIGLAVVALLVLLAAMGVASGLWSKNLVVDGTVETGDLRVDWTFNTTGTGDDQCTLFNPLFPCDGLVPKDVGKFECSVDEFDNQILYFTVSNAYPSYEADCQYHFANTGSIPWIVRGAEVIAGPTVTGCGGDINPDPKTLVIDCDQITIGYFDNIGDQVDPGNEVSGSLKVHVKQEAAQSDCTADSTDVPTVGVIVFSIDCDPTTLVSYDFELYVCVAQWNEAATYEECKSSPQHEGPSPNIDKIIDADGITTAGDGLGTCGLPSTPGSLDVSVGDPISFWPASGSVGIDWFDKGSPGNGVWDTGCNGDDLHSEGSLCATGDRNGKYDLGLDCKILDLNGDLADGEGVECDLESGLVNPAGFSTDGVACPPTNNLGWFDANGSGNYDLGEDIVLDANNNGVFD